MKLVVSDGLSLEKLLLSGQCFRGTRKSGAYYFTHQGHVVRMIPLSNNEFDVDCPPTVWNDVWSQYFDLTRSYRKLFKTITHPMLTRVITLGEGIRTLRQDPWEMFITFIISQRKTPMALKNSIKKLCELIGTPIEHEDGTFYAFPSPKAIYEAREEVLYSCDLGYRLPYIKSASKLVTELNMNLNVASPLTNEELERYLRQFQGVGAKVARSIMLFGYARQDVILSDIWLTRFVKDVCGGNHFLRLHPQLAGVLQPYIYYYMHKHNL